MNVDLTRDVKVRPAFDCIRNQPCVHGSDRCRPGEGGSHGLHNAVILFTLRGPDAELTLDLGTGWYLPETPSTVRRLDDDYPKWGALTFHAREPWYEGQDPYAGGDCELWDVCYLDVGFLIAEKAGRILVAEGTDGLWPWLEDVYAEQFYATSDDSQVVTFGGWS